MFVKREITEDVSGIVLQRLSDKVKAGIAETFFIYLAIWIDRSSQPIILERAKYPAVNCVSRVDQHANDQTHDL
jgi:hypothetical protein